MSEETKAIVKKDIGQQVIDRVTSLCEAGFTMPHDFNYVNAIKATMLMLPEIVDKNKRPALEVCTPASIQSALFEACTKGLDISKRQAYLLVRGNKLCLHVSYFGHILQVKRLFPNWSPVAHTIREGDDFVYTINPENGKIKLVKHEQKLENLDKDFIGAYMYLPCSDGETELYVMTRKQILKAWSKSSSTTLQTHKDFDEKMALKTIINSGCTKVINATPNTEAMLDNDEDVNNIQDPVEEKDYSEFEEVTEEENQTSPNANAEVPQPKENIESENNKPEENDDEF